MNARQKSSFLSFVKRLLAPLVGDYSAYFIYQSPKAAITASSKFTVRLVGPEELGEEAEDLFRQQAFYLGPQSRGFACFEGQTMVGLCFYWYGERYRQRNFWPLQDRQAKLVQIVTLPQAQGRGVATTLIRESLVHLQEDSFCSAFARVWHSNVPSYKAFERAGWRRIAFVMEIHPFGRRVPYRLEHRLKK